MTREEIEKGVVGLLCEIAPEIDPKQLQPDAEWRDQLDIDSVDLLNFVVAMHKAFGLEIPESDYAKLATLNGCVDYLQSHGAKAT